MTIKISTAELRRLTELLFAHLEKTGNSIIELPDDYYWKVPDDQRYVIDTEPKVLNIGQLSFDLKDLQSIDRGENEPLAYGFVWLSSILRAVGEQVVS
jgi:hypothetical protein